MGQAPLENDDEEVAILPKLSDIAVVVAGGSLGTAAQLAVRVSTVSIGAHGFTAVMLVNMIGAFGLSMFTAIARTTPSGARLKLFVATGLLGSLTTYSSMVATSTHPVWFGLGIMAGVAAIGLGFWLGDAVAARRRRS